MGRVRCVVTFGRRERAGAPETDSGQGQFGDRAAQDLKAPYRIMGAMAFIRASFRSILLPGNQTVEKAPPSCGGVSGFLLRQRAFTSFLVPIYRECNARGRARPEFLPVVRRKESRLDQSESAAGQENAAELHRISPKHRKRLRICRLILWCRPRKAPKVLMNGK